MPIQSPVLNLLRQHFDPMTEWNRRHQAIFIHLPRTAGTSLGAALGQEFPHIPISRFAAMHPGFTRQAFKFCVVRNPWDRILSSYSVLRNELEESDWPLGLLWAEKAIGQTKTFEEFILCLEDRRRRKQILRHPHFRSQIDWIRIPGTSEISMDFAGRFETLEEDSQYIFKRLGIRAALPHVNASSHAGYREAYSRRMRDIVGEIYGPSAEAFDYQF